INIRGLDGCLLKDAWSEGPLSYLGLAVAGFPNLFTIVGPGSPSVLSNVIVSIEQHIEWVSELLVYARKQGFDLIEAESEAARDWTTAVTDAARDTLFMKGKSWYLGANVPGKARVFMPYIKGVGAYSDACEEVAANKYRGFQFGNKT